MNEHGTGCVQGLIQVCYGHWGLARSRAVGGGPDDDCWAEHTSHNHLLLSNDNPGVVVEGNHMKIKFNDSGQRASSQKNIH